MEPSRWPPQAPRKIREATCFANIQAMQVSNDGTKISSRLHVIHLNLLLCHVDTDDRTLLPHQGCTHIAVPSTAAAQVQHAQSCTQARETHG